MITKRKSTTEIDPVDEPQRRSARSRAGQGGAADQLERAGNAVSQALRKRPRHVVPPSEPVNKMAPVPSSKRTRTKVGPKKRQFEATVAERPVHQPSQGSSRFGFKRVQDSSESEDRHSSPPKE